MYSKALGVLALLSAAFAHDIIEGTNSTEERKVFESHEEASPAIWKQTKDLFINGSEHEVISKINITDLRPDKNGEAQIISGGIGHNNVTITLKSPTILRGYDFLVSVYTAVGDEQPRDTQNITNPQKKPSQSFVQNPQVPEEKIPVEIPSDAASRKPELHAESGPTAGTGEPTEGNTKPSEVNTTANAKGTTTATGVVTTSKPKEFSEPDVTEDPEIAPVEPVLVEKDQQKLQPFDTAKY